MNFDDGSFDVVIEKGLLDCLACMDEAKLEMAKCLKEVHRVLKLQGLFFCISFNHDRAEHLEDEPWKFRLRESRRISAPGGQNSLYVFQKSDSDALQQWPQMLRDLKLGVTEEDHQLVDQPFVKLIEADHAVVGDILQVAETFESGMVVWSFPCDHDPVKLPAGLCGIVKLRDHDGDALIRFPRLQDVYSVDRFVFNENFAKMQIRVPQLDPAETKMKRHLGTRAAVESHRQHRDLSLPQNSEATHRGDSDEEMAPEEMSELKGFNMPLSFGKQKPVRTAGPNAHNATQRKGRGEKPVPKGVQFGPRITDTAAKVGAQARQIKAVEAQPGPEEDASEEEDRVGPVMPQTGREEPDELPEPGKELQVIPVTHEVDIPCFDKPTTAIGLDPKGSRMIAGGLDGTLKFFDFHGMSEAKDAFRSLEPVVGKMVHSVSFSTTGGQVLIVCSDASARIYDRDGSSTPIQQTVLGDMYVRQMEHTKGHTQTLTAGMWHPFRSEHFLTSSLDGTMRIWDMTADPVGMDQQLPCIHVLKTVDKRNVCVGGGSGKQGGLFPTCCTYSPTDAKKIVAGCSDGSVQLFFDKARFMRPDRTRALRHSTTAWLVGHVIPSPSDFPCIAMRRYFASPWVEAQHRHLSVLASRSTSRALDLGCGKGRHAMLLMDMGFEVTAIDCDAVSLDYLRQRGGGKLTMIQMDLEAEDVSTASLGHFDAILVVNFACRALLPKLPKLLKEDGILIFESWAEGNEKYAMAKDAKALQGLLRPNELLDALTEHCTVLSYAHGLQEDYEGRDCCKQMICCRKRRANGISGVQVSLACPLARLLHGDASFLQATAFGQSFAGGAIYFSRSPDGACRKYKNGRGNPEILIECNVQLGRCLEAGKHVIHSREDVQRKGFDSVKIDGLDVYAVYEPWRVTALRFRRVGGFESFHSMQALRPRRQRAPLSPAPGDTAAAGYAVLRHHWIFHWAMSPIRLLYRLDPETCKGQHDQDTADTRLKGSHALVDVLSNLAPLECLAKDRVMFANEDFQVSRLQEEGQPAASEWRLLVCAFPT
eukprot:symbB.v1.2.004585.t1/scaffold261.1/size248783/13